MPGHSSREKSAATLCPDEQAAASLRALNRSPHPYHHQSSDLLHPSEQFLAPADASRRGRHIQAARHGPSVAPSSSKESAPGSDSGTDADDEHFLRGLPAPKARPHKGLRGLHETVSGTTTPVLSPGPGEEEMGIPLERKASQRSQKPEAKRRVESIRRKKVMLRRTTEVAIVLALAVMIAKNQRVSPIIHAWRRDFQSFGLLYLGLLALYPLRLLRWTLRNSVSDKRLSIKIPSSFDPAPVLYPSAITIFVSLLVSVNHPAVIMPNIILAISAIPQQLVPKLDLHASYDSLHWALSCLPLIWNPSRLPSQLNPTISFLPRESLALLYPLHRILGVVLHHLTTTSLLITELQLLSISLVNVALLASSPQAQILKALLWYGGLSMLATCGGVIQWGIALARVPKWRFRREAYPQKRSFWNTMVRFLTLQRRKSDMVGVPFELDEGDKMYSSGEDDDAPLSSHVASKIHSFGPSIDLSPAVDVAPSSPDQDLQSAGMSRRFAVPQIDNKPSRKPATHTPSGKKKRTTSISVRAYFKLTSGQATVRRWVYAAYVYLCLLAIIAVVVRMYIQTHALGGSEPIGWALGYLFGDLPWFRFQVVHANLQRWICLPERVDARFDRQCHLGWVQRIRHADFGEANTRLIISGCWVGILIVGLAIVFQLKNTFEVDTRRKVFHFMMVGMLLPATYVDPAFAALALSIVLAIFLILDLLRASQLPPLSKPIATFLAPYVDGRDFRGPVVISHIFLLIGCAIPLWLSLASLPRAGSGFNAGWEIPTREVGMISGVVCVGLGDAAASLVGRHHGRRKWVWGGGKSIEGSVAFMAAVFVGLMAANAWLRVGGWPTTTSSATGASTSWMAGSSRSLVCASVASLTEAVLTGGNDNVIVPVVLWTCVKALEI